jgi:hypothetical protein
VDAPHHARHLMTAGLEAKSRDVNDRDRPGPASDQAGPHPDVGLRSSGGGVHLLSTQRWCWAQVGRGRGRTRGRQRGHPFGQTTRQPKPGQAEADRAGPSRGGPSRGGPSRGGPSRTEPGRTEPGRTEPDRAGADRAGADRAGAGRG